MPVVTYRCNPCCGCVGLKTASLIAGYVQLGGFIALFSYLIYNYVSKMYTNIDHSSALFIMQCLMVTLISYIAFIILMFIIVLIVGIYMNKRNFIKAYMIAIVIFLGFAVIGFLMYTIIVFEAKVFFPGIFLFALFIYFLVIILTYCHKLGVEVQRSSAE